MNRFEVKGRLGKDVELRYTPSGIAVAKVSLAEGFKQKDGSFSTTWWNVVSFKDTAIVMGEKLKKGSTVEIKGYITKRKYIAKDGTDKEAMEVICQEFKIPSQLGNTKETLTEENLEDIPF